MVRLSDELLMAYVDGELDADTAAQVERALENDSEARATLEAFRASRRALEQAFGSAVEALVPQRPKAVSGPASSDDWPAAALAAVTRSSADNVLPFALRPSPQLVRQRLWAAGTGIVALVAGLLGYQLGQGRAGFDEAALGAALAATPSFEAVSLDGGIRQVMPVASYAMTGGGYCRELEEVLRQSGTSTAYLAVACRGGDGEWRVLAKIADGTAGGFQSHSAGGEPSTGRTLLRAVLADARPLDHASEAELIRQGWRTP